MNEPTFSLRSRFIACAALVALSSGCGSNGPTADVTTAKPLAATDAAFVGGATQSSDAEISAANLALTKSQNADVLSFAKEMITDHTQENNELANDTRFVSPGAPVGTVNPMQAAEAQKLMSLSGAAFDKEYVDSEIQGHTLNLDDNFKPEIGGGSNAGIVAYANKFEPQIEMHLSMIQTIAMNDGL